MRNESVQGNTQYVCENVISNWSNAYLANSLRLMLDAGTPYQSAAIFGAVRDEGEKMSTNLSGK